LSLRPRLAISLGDPCGIGPELLLGSLPVLHRWADVIVVGARAGPDLLESRPPVAGKVAWGWDAVPDLPAGLAFPGVAAHGLWVQGAPGSEGRALWLDPTPAIGPGSLPFAEPSAASGACALAGARLAARIVLAGQADALVTLPLSKAACHLAGENIPGHTELLQALAGSPITRMAFLSPSLRVVLHTVHQSLASAIADLEAGAVAETLRFTADRFIQLLGRSDLRIALCALNPHAGERGAFGHEEARLEEARLAAEAAFVDFEAGAPGPYAALPSPFPPGPAPEGWQLFPSGGPAAPPPSPGRKAPRFFGPLPADSLFHRAAQGEFDVVVALYHDQGLIPIKTLEPARAVNVTLGLPFIRTSPDHGTAFDKAGRWIADPANFREACALAVRLAARAQAKPWHAEVDSGGS
jgi:4-hydroxythreonine-4-phosphate dehydrogenase